MFISLLLLLCALCLSGIAGYYSVVGMASIFSSAFWPVVIMTGVLEVSKLVVSSWLYQKWEIVPKLLKVYLTSAVIVLMAITSLGIFGFLSKSHLDQSLGNTTVELQIQELDTKITNSKSVIERYNTQLQQLDRAFNIQLDARRATIALAERRRQEAERDGIRKKLDEEFKNVEDLESKRTDLKQKISVLENKVGPIKYVAEFFSDGKTVDLDRAVRWMIVVIIFVFDPLAVLMIIAANLGIKHWLNRPKPDDDKEEDLPLDLETTLDPKITEVTNEILPVQNIISFKSAPIANDFKIEETEIIQNNTLTANVEDQYAITDNLIEEIKLSTGKEHSAIEILEKIRKANIKPILMDDRIDYRFNHR